MIFNINIFKMSLQDVPPTPWCLWQITEATSQPVGALGYNSHLAPEWGSGEKKYGGSARLDLALIQMIHSHMFHRNAMTVSRLGRISLREQGKVSALTSSIKHHLSWNVAMEG